MAHRIALVLLALFVLGCAHEPAMCDCCEQALPQGLIHCEAIDGGWVCEPQSAILD